MSLEIRLDDRFSNVELVSKEKNKLQIKVDDKLYELDMVKVEEGMYSILLDGKSYNVEIIETHHNQKKDSPSGTAVGLAERAAEALGLDYAGEAVHGRKGMVGARPVREIGMHAVRGGDVIGEHTVSFIGQGERVELTHRAHSRDNFARGALRAARFVLEAEPGLYDMQDVLGLK